LYNAETWPVWKIYSVSYDSTLNKFYCILTFGLHLVMWKLLVGLSPNLHCYQDGRCIVHKQIPVVASQWWDRMRTLDWLIAGHHYVALVQTASIAVSVSVAMESCLLCTHLQLTARAAFSYHVRVFKMANDATKVCIQSFSVVSQRCYLKLYIF
jgi:hypothetical protein